jgi:hypothetical protein
MGLLSAGILGRGREAGLVSVLLVRIVLVNPTNKIVAKTRRQAVFEVMLF